MATMERPEDPAEVIMRLGIVADVIHALEVRLKHPKSVQHLAYASSEWGKAFNRHQEYTVSATLVMFAEVCEALINAWGWTPEQFIAHLRASAAESVT